MSYKNNTKGFVNMIKNGWLYSPKESINKVYDAIYDLILHKKTKSETINIFNAHEVKKYIEEVLGEGVQIHIWDNTVCAKAYVIVNIDYDQLSDCEYYELKEFIKNNKK